MKMLSDPPPAVPVDAHLRCLQPSGELLAGELRPLVGVEDSRRPSFQGSIQRRQAKRRESKTRMGNVECRGLTPGGGVTVALRMGLE